MKKVINRLTVLCMAASIAVSCGKQPAPEPGDGQGKVKISLSADNTLDEKFTTKSEPTLTATDFKVRIENTRGEVLKNWATYDDVPETLFLQAGSYKLVAWYGGDVLPNFGDSYYYGETKFSVADGEDINVSLVCTMAASKVTVAFDSESFGYNYSAWSADVKTTGDGYLTFSSGETREAYFTPGNLYIRFSLTSLKDGQTYTYNVEEPIEIKAREFWRLNIKVNSNNGGLALSIVTDETTNDHQIDVEIPLEALEP